MRGAGPRPRGQRPAPPSPAPRSECWPRPPGGGGGSGALLAQLTGPGHVLDQPLQCPQVAGEDSETRADPGGWSAWWDLLPRLWAARSLAELRRPPHGKRPALPGRVVALACGGTTPRWEHDARDKAICVGCGVGAASRGHFQTDVLRLRCGSGTPGEWGSWAGSPPARRLGP